MRLLAMSDSGESFVVRFPELDGSTSTWLFSSLASPALLEDPELFTWRAEMRRVDEPHGSFGAVVDRVRELAREAVLSLPSADTSRWDEADVREMLSVMKRWVEEAHERQDELLHALLEVPAVKADPDLEHEVLISYGLSR